jgi:hypothetical protein
MKMISMINKKTERTFQLSNSFYCPIITEWQEQVSKFVCLDYLDRRMPAGISSIPVFL